MADGGRLGQPAVSSSRL